MGDRWRRFWGSLYRLRIFARLTQLEIGIDQDRVATRLSRFVRDWDDAHLEDRVRTNAIAINRILAAHRNMHVCKSCFGMFAWDGASPAMSWWLPPTIDLNVTPQKVCHACESLVKMQGWRPNKRIVVPFEVRP